MRILGQPLLALSMLGLCALPTSGSGNRPVEEYVCKYSGRHVRLFATSDRLLIRFETGVLPAARDAIAESWNLEQVHSSDNPHDVGVYRVRDAIPETAAVTALTRRLSSLAEIAAATSLMVDDEGHPQHIIDNQFTVQFVAELSPQACEDTLLSRGSSIVRQQRTPGYYTARVADGKGLYEAIREWNQVDTVAFAEPSWIGFGDSLFVPDDPLYGNQWNHDNTGQTGGTPDADVQSDQAWDDGLGDRDTVIVVIDTGMDLDHPDLVGNLYPRDDEDWNFASETSSVPEDPDGHGTSCAGITAAIGNNGTGITGMCPGCRIMPLAVDLTGGTVQERIDAIQYATQFQLAHPELRLILNNSWRLSTGHSAAMQAALDCAAAAEIPVLCAAGNESGEVVYPARYASTIAVGASTQCDERKSETSCDNDPAWASATGLTLDVVAPGVRITTTGIGGYRSTFAGTSAASPLAAGIIGLILSKNPWLTADEARAILTGSACDEVGPAAEDPPGHDRWMGWGRVDASQAVVDTPTPASPMIDSFTPDAGLIHRHTEVAIAGSGFFGDVEVEFDGVPAHAIEVLDSNTIIATTPRGSHHLPVDLVVRSDTGVDTISGAYTYAPLLQPLQDARIGQPLDFYCLGTPLANYGVVIDYFPGPTKKKGLVWDIGFIEAQIIHNSFHSSDAPLNAFGQGRPSYLVADDPSLIGQTIYSQMAIDANGEDAGRPIALSAGARSVVLP